PNWSAAYVGSMELFNFFKGRAKAYGVYDHLHLAHKIEKAVWDGDAGTWTISIRDLEKNTSFVTKAEVLINAAGFLNGWKWPEGLKEFGGHLVHSARWDESYDFTGKTVAVIGSGSSAIQIVPELQPGKKLGLIELLLDHMNDSLLIQFQNLSRESSDILQPISN
nr:hypothetical protein [Tanacetum cinerariifolium]